VGYALLGLDLLLLLYWNASAIVIYLHDRTVLPAERLLLVHLVAAMHFTGTIAICLALEAFAKVRERHARGGTKRSRSFVNYACSWGLVYAVALCTDLFLLLYVVNENKIGESSWLCELVLAIWALADCSLTVLWSLWLLSESRTVRLDASAHPPRWNR
jgi:hypothetical protein